MEKIIFGVLIITSACCLSAKHVYVEDKLPWGEARAYCRDYHTDVSPLTNGLEQMVFNWSMGDPKEGWIGIYWNKTVQKWVWSGGDIVTYHNDLDLQNDGLVLLQSTADNVYWTVNGWQWKNGGEKHSFFCFDLTVVQEEKTWEEALEHCRKNNGHLTSLLSVTENLLATNEIQQSSIRERVWIGLRYLGDSWMWVNGAPLEYDAWSQGGDQDRQCPMKRRCGALTKEGVWESWDCQEKLSFICY